MELNLPLGKVGKISSELAVGSARILTTERKSAAFLHTYTPSDGSPRGMPKAYASFDGKFLQCNNLFSDITAISEERLKELTILSIIKFESFEGPQTANYIFDELSRKANSCDVPPEFHWSGPLGAVREGLVEKSMDVIVTSERHEIDGNCCLTVVLAAPKKRALTSSRLAQGSMNMSYGSLKEAEVLESSAIKKYRILLVDESLGTLKMIQRQINSTGHDADIEQDRREAVDYLKTDRYDVAVFEIGLSPGGGLSGLNIAHEWRLFESVRQPPETPLIIIAMAADYDDSMFMEAMNAGFDGFILKPFSPTDFLSVILMIDDSRRGGK
jgi:CheY-like chemotaxis protein